MAWVYILRGSSGRHYIGSTDNLSRRLQEHRHGGTHTTARLGDELTVVVTKEFASIKEARQVERALKRKKSSRVAIYSLSAMPEL